MVTVWDVARRTVSYDLDDFTDRITAVAFHPEGLRLAVASQDQGLVLWNLKAGKGRTLPKAGAICRQLAFSPDGSLLAAAADDRVLIWKLADGKSPVKLALDGSTRGSTGGAGTAVTSLAFHPAGDAIVAAGNEGYLWLWNDPARKRNGDEPDQVIRVGPEHGLVKRVIWAPEGRHVLSVNGNGMVYVLRLQDDRN